MDIQLNDILVMKKAHPCGGDRWLVLRTGADFRLRCLKCGHELMTPRFKDLGCKIELLKTKLLWSFKHNL